jgi:tetratricopeptide (TPR) repeat protein
MSTVIIDNRDAAIGQQVVGEQVFFGGERPSPLEREGLRQQIAVRFARAIGRGAVAVDEAVEIDAALRRLLGPRADPREGPGCRLVDVEVPAEAPDELLLPLELLGPPAGAAQALVRCELDDTATVAEAPRAYPEGGRIVLATTEPSERVPGTVLEALRRVCGVGLHLAFGSEHDRRRGAFADALDHLPRASCQRLYDALGPRGDRPGAAVLLLVCGVSEHGPCLHADEGGEAVVAAEALAGTLAPFASHLRLVVLMPVAHGPSVGDPGRTIVELAAALHRHGLASVVAPRLPLPGSALPELVATLLGALLGGARIPPTSLEVAVTRTNARLAAHPGLAYLGLRLYARAADGDDTRPLVIRPYRGLLSFGPEHARFYVGREPEIDEVGRRLTELDARGQPRLVLLVGASGVGKSSLATAGVVPALAGDGWVPLLVRPIRAAVEPLDAALAGIVEVRRLLVVDQLEDVFAEAGSQQAVAAYLQRLWALASTPGVAVIATLRVDALDHGGAVMIDASAGRTLEQLVPGPHAMFVHHLDAAAIRRVIAEPARHVGLELDPGLVDRLCAEMLAEPGALPMLELVLDRLWSRREGRRMVASAHEGGLAVTLAAQANACVDALPEAQRTQAKRILVRLATGPVVGRTARQRRATVDALRPERRERRAAFDVALASLVDARLVVRATASRAGDPEASIQDLTPFAAETIELAHELLLRRWDALRGWIEASAPRLAAIRNLDQWVDEWSKRRTLLTPSQLTYIDAAKLSAEDDDLNGRMLELVAASRRAVRRRRLLRRVLLAGIGVVAIAFAGLSYWALGQRDIARQQTRIAEAERNHASEQAEMAEQERSTATQQTALAEEQSRLAKERLNRVVALVEDLVRYVLPELDPYPEVAEIRLAILDKLGQMLTRLRPAAQDFQAQSNLVLVHAERAGAADKAGDTETKLEELEAAHTIAAELWRAHPDRPMARTLVIESLYGLAIAETESGELGAARAHFLRLLDAGERLQQLDPESTKAQREIFRALFGLGTVTFATNDLELARGTLRRGIALADALSKTDPSDSETQRDLDGALWVLGTVEKRAGNFVAAREVLQRSLALREAVVTAKPQDSKAKRAVCQTLEGLGDVELDAGNHSAAHDFYRRCVAIREALAGADPEDAKASFDVIVTLMRRGLVAMESGDGPTLREVAAVIEQRLAAMDAKGQVAGTPQERALVRRLLQAAEKAAGE